MKPKEAADYVGRGLLEYYDKYVKPVEAAYHFDKFMTPLLTEADFMAAPMVLLMGQYSVGKTTFIRFLLGRDFPGARIGPEPTTDKFCAVMHGKTERVIPGNAAAVQKDKPFRALESFGMSFLNRFEVSELEAPLLEHITLIDSPGILSGEKQRIQRGYDFASVVSYWATRADRILLLFDAHKLDISDELKEAILAIRGNFDKIRCVLNKADQVNQQQLMRIYGALLWSLGKVVQTPEVMRVYISSFWEKEYQNKEAEKLFDLEKSDLLADLRGLPRGAALRKVNEFVKRARRCKVHSLICDTLRSKFGFFSKEKKQEQLLQEMPSIFQTVSTKYNVPLGDFPNPQKFASIIKNWEIWKFPPLKPQQISAIDDVLERGIPRLLEKIELKEDPLTGNKLNWNPFNSNEDEDDGMNGIGVRWVVSQQQKEIYDEKFFKLETTEGKASGSQIKQVMLQSGLSSQVLGKVWGLSDLDKDGAMNSEEFALCMFLLEEVKNGNTLPDQLPEEYVPPSFRKKQEKKTQNPFDGIPTNNGGNTLKSPTIEKKVSYSNLNTNTNNDQKVSSQNSKRDVLDTESKKNENDNTSDYNKESETTMENESYITGSNNQTTNQNDTNNTVKNDYNTVTDFDTFNYGDNAW